MEKITHHNGTSKTEKITHHNGPSTEKITHHKNQQNIRNQSPLQVSVVVQPSAVYPSAANQGRWKTKKITHHKNQQNIRNQSPPQVSVLNATVLSFSSFSPQVETFVVSCTDVVSCT
jgi:hypothetical protein